MTKPAYTKTVCVRHRLNLTREEVERVLQETLIAVIPEMHEFRLSKEGATFEWLVFPEEEEKL